ncbi:carbonic anhydrase [Micromonospora sp. CPCC 206060]|uniref:carbonic anhydrase n=1 Tax=Micromonospora sp. CPCC 206060 TaxID=3122406 RepID=UPI002FEE8B0C
MSPFRAGLSHPSRRALLAVAALVAAGVTVPAAAPARAQAAPGPAHRAPAQDPGRSAQPGSPQWALRRLLAGNRRFVRDRARHPRQSVGHLREVADGQHPSAVILGCADSRVAPEILFDQGIGDLFDNRVAGNVADDLLVGSIEYAVVECGSPLVVVLGHERCGAVTATIDAIRYGGHAPGRIGDIIEALRPVVEPVLDDPGDPVDNAVRANILAQTRALHRSAVLRDRIATGQLRLVPAHVDLDTGRVTLLDGGSDPTPDLTPDPASRPASDHAPGCPAGVRVPPR